jgi:hypothetical protein
MSTDAEWYRYVNHCDDDDLCVMCREETADPDSIEGMCNWCETEEEDE